MNSRPPGRATVAIFLFLVLHGCAFVSRGEVRITAAVPTAGTLEDDVARIVAPALEQYGLQPVWSFKQRDEPCVTSRGCNWAPEGKGWLQPWVSLNQANPGQIRVRIEARHDTPGRDSKVKAVTEDVAKALRSHYGGENVAVESSD